MRLPPLNRAIGGSMTENLVHYDVQPPAIVLTLNRVDKRNALSRSLIAALGDAFDRARQEPRGRCVIVTGAGPAFCAGMDLSELAESLSQAESAGPSHEGVIWQDALHLAQLYDMIYRF